MRKQIQLLSLFLLWSIIATASHGLGIQRYNPSFRLKPFYLKEDGDGERFRDRLTFGGNIGLQIGNPTNIILSPAIGYILPWEKLQNKMIVGLGVTYMYYRVKYNGLTYESNIYGGRTFIRYLVFSNIFAYTEYELLNSPPYYVDLGGRVWASSLFVGGGYLLKFSERGGVMITVLYNLLWTAVHPVYSSPWNFRVGFML